jgi:hypothetical protein
VLDGRNRISDICSRKVKESSELSVVKPLVLVKHSIMDGTAQSKGGAKEREGSHIMVNIAMNKSVPYSIYLM